MRRARSRTPRAALAAGGLLLAVLGLLATARWLTQPQPMDATWRPDALVSAPPPRAAIDAQPVVPASPAADERPLLGLQAAAGTDLPTGPPFAVDVRDAEGRPIAGARVTVSGRRALTAATDGAGRALLPGDPFTRAAPGAVSLEGSALCFRPASVVLQPPQSDSLLVRDNGPPAPPCLVLQRCAVLQVVLQSGDPDAEKELFVRLRTRGRMFDSELPRETIGAIGGERRKPLGSGGLRREPFHDDVHVDGAERAVGKGERDDPEGEARLYDFSPGGTRLIVGLRPGQPIRVLVAGAWGEPLFEQVVTLGAEEWRRLDAPIAATPRDLTVLVSGRGPARVLDLRAGLDFERPAFTLSVASRYVTSEGQGCLLFPHVRASLASVHLQAERFASRTLPDLPLGPGENSFDAVMERNGAPRVAR